MPETPTGDPYRILFVDDDAGMRRFFVRLAERLGYQVETAEDGVGALSTLSLAFDMVVIDAEMPHMDGFEAAEKIRTRPEYRHLPILMVTGLVGSDYRRRALEIGINDFLPKPLDVEEFALKSKWLLPLKRAYDQLEQQRGTLERQVAARTYELRQALERTAEGERRTRRAHLETVRRLMIAAEYKDRDTAGHIDRIGQYSEILARTLAHSPSAVTLIRHAAAMHDVGKIGIPDHILLKPGALDDDEWIIMRSHTTIGVEILGGSDSPLLQMGERIAASHHEKWDGTGYPNGLRGDTIPVEGRICAVVDYFDALTMNRPYRPALPVGQVLRMMKDEGDARFSPDVLQAFFSVQDEIKLIRELAHSGQRADK